MMAANMDHTNVVRLLLRKGARVDHQSKHKSTALHYAAYGGHTATARVLLEAGANRALKNEYGDTPEQ